MSGISPPLAPSLPARPRLRALAAVDAASAAHAAGTMGLAGGIGWLAASGGGYFPTTWGWATLGFAWVAATALALRGTLGLGRLELATLAGLAGLAAWTFASAAWTSSTTSTMLEGQRSLVYVSGVAALCLVVRRRGARTLLGALLASVAAVCGWALVVRLLPDRIGVFDPDSSNRLAGPIGYWNALGLVAAMGALLAVGLAARAHGPARRAAAAALVPPLLLALYLSFGRAAWIALALGLAVAFAADARRLQLLTVTLALSPAAGLAVWAAAREPALVRRGAALEAAAQAGHRVLGAVAALALLSAATGAALALAERRVAVPGAAVRAYGTALALLAAAGVLAVFAAYGSPQTMAARAYDAFVHSRPAGGDDVGGRLLSLSGTGRAQLWSAAWQNAREHPWGGSGAGTYEAYWLEHRTEAMKVRDAHSLYLETLSELGPLGLGLLALALGAPLAAGVRARSRSLTPVALGAYAAFLLHAGVDWDWELTGVALVGLACAVALLASARPRAPGPLSPRARRAGLAAVALAALLGLGGLLGNLALARSVEAAAGGDWEASALWAGKAQTYAPWSSQPWRRLGLAQAEAAEARPYLLRAVEADPADWRLWLELAWASEGAEQAAALAEARRLNRHSTELAEFRRWLAAQAEEGSP